MVRTLRGTAVVSFVSLVPVGETVRWEKREGTCLRAFPFAFERLGSRSGDGFIQHTQIHSAHSVGARVRPRAGGCRPWLSSLGRSCPSWLSDAERVATWLILPVVICLSK